MINPFSIKLPLPLVSKFMKLEVDLARLKEQERIFDISQEAILIMLQEDALNTHKKMKTQEFRDFLRNSDYTMPRDQALMGIGDALEYIFLDKMHGFKWDVGHLQKIYQLMCGNGDFGKPIKLWRSSPEFEADFSVPPTLMHVSFEYAPFEEISALMVEFTQWINSQDVHPFISPILKIGTALPLFAIIAPFERNNARMMRFLALDLLGFYGLDVLQKATFIEEFTTHSASDHLYKILKNLSEGEMDFTFWLENWASVLQKTIIREREKIKQIKGMAFVPQRLHSPISLKIQKAFKKADKLTISEIAKTTNVNRNTLKGYLRNMVKAGMLFQIGEKKACWYEANTEYQEKKGK